MTLIEQLVKNMDFPVIASKLAHKYNLSTQYEKKFYFLENKVKMVSEFVQRRLKTLEKQRMKHQ